MSDIFADDPRTCNNGMSPSLSLPLVPDGFTCCARIGNPGTGSCADAIRYAIMVDSSNYWVTVHYAAVLELANHVDEMESRFGIRFQDTAGKPLPVGNLEFSIKDTARMIKCGKVYWTEWEDLGVNLSAWMGQTVELVIYAMDCGKSGHYGYGYAVCECGTNKPTLTYCQRSQNAILEAANGYKSYVWKDSSGKVLDTVRRISLHMPVLNTSYYCISTSFLGITDTLSVKVRQTVMRPGMNYRLDSTYHTIRLSNISDVTGDSIVGQMWQVGKPGKGIEFTSMDTAFECHLKDTGLYEVLLTLYTENGCTDTCVRHVNVKPVPADVEMLAFLEPGADTLWDVHSFYPKVRMVNYGPSDAYMAEIHLEMYDSNMVMLRKLTEPVSNFKMGDTLDLLFSKSLRCLDFTGRYYFKAYVDLYGNSSRLDNDTLLKQVYMRYPDTVNLSIGSFSRSNYGFYHYDSTDSKWKKHEVWTNTNNGIVTLVWLHDDFYTKNPIKVCAKLTKKSNYLMPERDSVRFVTMFSDSAGNELLRQEVWLPASFSGDSSFNFLEGRKIPYYRGYFWVKMFFDAHPNDYNYENDTFCARGYCQPIDTVLVNMLSVRPHADSVGGKIRVYPKVTLRNGGNVDMKNFKVKVLVMDSNFNKITQLDETIALLARGDTIEKKFTNSYGAPDYDGIYHLLAFYTDTVSYVAHCFYRPDTFDIEMFSIRPEIDTVVSGNSVKPIVKLMLKHNKSNGSNLNPHVDIYVFVYDSNHVPLNGLGSSGSFYAYYGDTITQKLGGYKVPNYSGFYYLRAYPKWDGSLNMVYSNDTVECKGYCIMDTVDFQMLSVRPNVDSAEGKTEVYPIIETYYRHPRAAYAYVDVDVQVFDSSHVILYQKKGNFFFNCNKKEETMLPGCKWNVPNYTGNYYIKVFFSNLKNDLNVFRNNDTVVFKAYCFKHLKTDVELVSVRPQHDSAEVGSWTSPVVMVKNLGDSDLKNIVVNVQVDSTVGYVAKLSDTIPFIAVGDSVEKVFASRYRVPDCGNPSNGSAAYYFLEAFVSADKDEDATNNRKDYKSYIHKTFDLRPISIFFPVDTLWGGNTVLPSVRIVNNSVTHPNQYGCWVEVCDSAGRVISEWSESFYFGPDEKYDTLTRQCTRTFSLPNYSGVIRMRSAISSLPKMCGLKVKDTLVQFFHFYRRDTIDVSLTNLVYPVTSELLIGCTRVYPTVYVRSRSNVVHHNLAITALVYDNVGALYDSITEIIPKLEAGTSVYRFNRCYKVPNAPGKYKLKVCLESPKGDLSVADNVVQGEFRSRVRPDTIDVALDTLLCPSVTETLLGNTEVRPQVRVVNRGNAEADSLVIDALVYDQSGALADSLMGMIVLLEEGTDTLYTFHSAYRVPNADGTYTLRLHVHAPYGDTCLENNVLQRKLRSRRNDSVDLQLLSVTLSDTGVLAGGAWVHPTVKVANLLCNADANNVKVYVEVLDSAGQRLDLLRENLARVPMADTVELVFADSLQVPDYTGKFWVRAYVEAAMYETDRSNDTLLCAYTCQSPDAVPSVAMDNWQLGQNIPNPAADKTLVPVTLPMPGTVRLQVFAADGRLLYRSEHAVAEGKSLLPLDLAGYAAGVYYYSVEYKGERKVRKMVVE